MEVASFEKVTLTINQTLSRVEEGIKLLDDLLDINVAKEIEDFINFGNSL